RNSAPMSLPRATCATSAAPWPSSASITATHASNAAIRNVDDRLNFQRKGGHPAPFFYAGIFSRQTRNKALAKGISTGTI
ncbi:MAG TPA: hypothetical protein VKA08_18065, partial [Balneolales bacterium]|nr:hypothetical protein [Balneolales bacterium]